MIRFYLFLILLLFFVNSFTKGKAFAAGGKQKVTKTMKLIEGVRGQELSTLLKLEKKHKKGKKHGEILIRIAELYYEKSQEIGAKEVEKYNREVEKFHKIKKGAQPKLNNTESRKYIYRSIQVYQRFIKNYGNHHLIDRALFNLAFNYKELGNGKVALRYFFRLVRTKKKSSLLPDTYLNIAEYYFDNNNWDQAKKYYILTSEYKHTKIYGYALYKLAWTYYNIKEYTLAISELENVAAYSRKPMNAQDDNRINLLKEALKDLVLFYSEAGERVEARNYFLRIGGKDNYIWMLERLAKIYIDNGNHTNAIAVYNDLISIDKYQQMNPKWVLAIVNSYETINNLPEMLEALNDLIVVFNPEGAWADYFKEKKDVLKETYELREKTLREFTKRYHKQAREKLRPRYYDIASELYEKYFKFFAQDANSYELRFFFAELLFERQKLLQAAEQYALVRDDMRSRKYMEKASFNVIYSYDKKIQEYEYIISSNMGNVKSLNKQIYNVEEKQILACDRYIEIVPKGKEIINIKFKAARLSYKHKKYNDARPRFAHIAETYPTNENAVFSVNLMLDSFNIEKNWIELNKWSRRFYGNQILVRQGTLAKDLYALIVDSSFKICLDLENNKKFEKAADKFDEFSQEFPDHKLAKEAILNSARNYIKADKLIAAIDMHKKFLKLYPGDKEVRNVFKALAINYEKIGYITIAASYYDMLIKKYPKDQDAEKAHYNIAYFYHLAGDFKNAIDYYKSFLTNYPTSLFCTEVILSLVNISRMTHDLESEKKYMNMYVSATKAKPDEVLGSMLRLGKLAAHEKNYSQANKYYKDAVKYFESQKKSSFIVGHRYVAEAQFLLSEMYYPQFSAIKLTLPKEKMIKQISDKIKIMEKMNKSYSKVFDYGATNFAIAALYKIGLSYEDFSKMLFGAPMPKGLTTEEIQAFKAELENVAFPIEEKAIKSFETNIKKAQELKVGANWAALSFEKMNKYRPKDYPVEIIEKSGNYLNSSTIYEVK